MMKVLEGSHAVSEAVRLARVSVISAYPITPQTHIVEALSEFCANKTMDASFICVESEHSAMAAVIGASSGGVRAFTASSSHGLALMHELLHWASGARLPIVMAEVNRAMGPGWNIWADQTDSLSQRDTGWIQLYCEDSQEALDTTLVAFKLAETVNLPVMVMMDAFFLSHTSEPVHVPDQEEADRFLPPFSPKIALDPKRPAAISQMVPPGAYMEMRQSIQEAMEMAAPAFDRIEDDFSAMFNRRYGQVEATMCHDAKIIIVVSGTAAGTCRQALQELRADGEKAGLLKIKMFRPFPLESVRTHLKNAGKVAVIDRNCSFGSGGIFASEIMGALCNMEKRPLVFSWIAGLGGRDITGEDIKAIYQQTKQKSAPESKSVWHGLHQT